MTLLDTEQVTRDLNKRFVAPLPEFYGRRIIFWKDEDREFEDKISDLKLDNAKVISLTRKNYFSVKKLITLDDTGSNYLVYCPLNLPQEENFLLSIELYSEEFRADLISIWMDEMHLTGSTSLREQIKSYRNFFKKKERREKFAAFSAYVNSPAKFQLAIMAVLCGLKDTRPNEIIKAVIESGTDIESNNIYQKFVEYEADNAFWIMTAQITGYHEDKNDLIHLIMHVMLTALTRTLSQERLRGLDRFISLPHQTYCYDLIIDWLHDDTAAFYELARLVEDETLLAQRFAKIPVTELIETEIFPGINEAILISLMTDIGNQDIDVELIKTVVEKRRTLVWYDRTEDFYEGIYQVANMQEFQIEHAAGFHTVEARNVWEEYTSDYYRMDTYYRYFHRAFIHSLNNQDILSDSFKHVADQVEGLYDTWYLKNLGSNWAIASEDELAQYGRILEVPRQEDFYNEKVKNKDNRIFVIVSDALRYEVAASLADQLRQETRADVELNSCSAIFPTVTKYGMAALLPHEKLSVEEKSNGLAVYADGSLTEANYRDAILKKAKQDSVAVKYKDIVMMKRKERNDLIKGNNIVYIYHDKIDETSHTDETLVFPSCDDAIDEIKNAIRIITNEFSGTNILITSDHGFLYTYKPLTEDDKLDKNTTSYDDVEVDRRYLVTKKGARPDYLLPVKFVSDDEHYDSFTPRENIRIKKRGAGLNFVHGGASLQEMVVPVISYHYLRNQSKEYQRNKNKYDTQPVELNLINHVHTISNMIFSLNFFQKDPIGSNRSSVTYLLYFVNEVGEVISDTQKIIADKTTDKQEERLFRSNFTLKPNKYSLAEKYYLIIEDETGLQLPQQEAFTINLPFATDMFDFSN